MFSYKSDLEQSEELLNWWRLNRVKLITAIISILLVLGGYQKFVELKQQKLAEASNMFDRVINGSDKQLALDLVNKYPKSPYAYLSKLWLAKQLCQQGKWQESIAIYKGIVEQSEQPALRVLANWYMIKAFVETKQYKIALGELSKINGQEALVNELRGDIYTITNQPNSAMTAYNAAYDATKDDNLRTRIQLKRQNTYRKK